MSHLENKSLKKSNFWFCTVFLFLELGPEGLGLTEEAPGLGNLLGQSPQIISFKSWQHGIPFIHEVFGQEAMNFEECVLTNGAVVAAPCEGGQISQEANRCPAAAVQGNGVHFHVSFLHDSFDLT